MAGGVLCSLTPTLTVCHKVVVRGMFLGCSGLRLGWLCSGLWGEWGVDAISQGLTLL